MRLGSSCTTTITTTTTTTTSKPLIYRQHDEQREGVITRCVAHTRGHERPEDLPRRYRNETQQITSTISQHAAACRICSRGHDGRRSQFHMRAACDTVLGPTPPLVGERGIVPRGMWQNKLGVVAEDRRTRAHRQTTKHHTHSTAAQTGRLRVRVSFHTISWQSTSVRMRCAPPHLLRSRERCVFL